MEEIWKPIKGYSMYEVSNLGRVRSYLRGRGKWAKLYDTPQKILKPGGSKDFYLSVVLLGDNGIKKSIQVHHAVAAAFLEPRPPGMLVLHGDDNKRNNIPENLRYGTHKDNFEDAEKNTGTILKAGEDHWFAKFTNDDVVSIRQRYANGESSEVLAREYGTLRKSITRITSGRRWKSVGGPITKKFTKGTK